MLNIDVVRRGCRPSRPPGRGLRFGIKVIAFAAAAAIPAVASAQGNGVWSQNANGTIYNWGDITNWNGGAGPIAGGANNSATFNSPLSSGIIINSDGSGSPRTIGSMLFDDAGSSAGWTIQGSNTITLSNTSGATIEVDNSFGSTTAPVTATISAPLAGSFTKLGAGNLLLSGNQTSLTGVTVSAGILGVTKNGSNNPLGTSTVTLAGGTLRLGDGSGYNQNMVVPATSPGPTGFATAAISATMDGGITKGGTTWYALGQNTAAPQTGLPMGTTFTSAGGYTYTLPAANNTTNNAMLLDGTSTTGRFVLATPTSGLSTISFLGSSGNGTTPAITAVIHYSDGTADASEAFASADWFNGGSTVAIGAGGRLASNGYQNINNPQSLTTPPYLYDETITNPNPSSTISSIDLSVPSSTGGHPVILSVSVPVVGGVAAQNYTNAVSVTSSSTIDVQTSLGASLGAMTINSSTLSVTAGILAAPTLTLPSITMTGNPTFSVGSGIVLTSSGTIADGGTARTVTFSGAGTTTVAGASPSLQPGTGVVVSAGTLNLNNTTSFGPSPAVNITGGNVNLGAGTNPTFNSLGGGTGGTLTLNGNVLTLSGGTAAYSGTIAAGTPATGSLIKTGAGVQTLSGATSTYTGGTTVSSGTLAAGPGSLGTGAITLSGGTLAVGPLHANNGFGGIGSGGNSSGWTTNSATTTFTGVNTLQLTTNAGNEAGSAWLNTPVTISPFTINFTYTVPAANGRADGFTVGFQNQGLTAVGAGGGGLAYQGITPSAAAAFNIYPPNTVGGVGSGIGLVTNGAAPSGTPAVATAPVDFGATNSPTNITITYDGTNVTTSFVQGTNTYTTGPIAFNIQSFVGSSAYFGFTGGTGGSSAQQVISNFSYVSSTYNSPTSAPGIYSNSVVVSSPSTLQVTTATGYSTVNMGPLSLGAALAITPDPTNAANSPYGLTFGGTTLTGAGVLNVTNNGSGLTTVNLGALSGTGSLSVTGGPALVVNGGSMGGRLNTGTSNVSLSGASLSVGSLAGTSGTLSGNSTSAITLTVGADNTTSTYGGTIVNGSTGTLAVVKTGTGTFTLTATNNTYSGGTTVLNGTLGIANDASLGTGPLNVNGEAALLYTATTSTSRTFNPNLGTIEAGSGATLTLNGATVVGGYLAGPGTFNVTGGTTLTGVTTYPSSPINISGNGTFSNFSNGSPFSIAANLVNPITVTRFTNQAGGAITVGNSSQLNVADFTSYGMVSLTPATGGVNNFTEMMNAGASPMYFGGGSQSFVGVATAPNANVVGVDLGGQNLILTGALLVNNGLMYSSVGSPTIYVEYGATYKGAGSTNVSVITQNGGKVVFGNCPGVATFGSLVLGSGGINNLDWEINDAGPSATFPHATGVAGPTSVPTVSGWGLGQVTAQTSRNGSQTYGNLTWTATPANKFNLEMETLAGPSSTVGATPDGLMADFDPTQSYSWPIVTYQGIYSGPTNDAQLTADTVFDTSTFANAVPAGAEFSLHLDQYSTGGGEIDLVYSPSPVPEPGTLALTGLAVSAGLTWYRRRRAK